MADRPDTGVPASPSGHSASPEPVVSALRASVPNAAIFGSLAEELERDGMSFLLAAALLKSATRATDR